MLHFSPNVLIVEFKNKKNHLSNVKNTFFYQTIFITNCLISNVLGFCYWVKLPRNTLPNPYIGLYHLHKTHFHKYTRNSKVYVCVYILYVYLYNQYSMDLKFISFFNLIFILISSRLSIESYILNVVFCMTLKEIIESIFSFMFKLAFYIQNMQFRYSK